MTVLAQAPALPLHRAGPYVAAAYIVFLAVILVYVTIMAVRLKRNERELAELGRELRAREEGEAAIGAGEVQGESEQAEAMSRP